MVGKSVLKTEAKPLNWEVDEVVDTEDVDVVLQVVVVYWRNDKFWFHFFLVTFDVVDVDVKVVHTMDIDSGCNTALS